MRRTSDETHGSEGETAKECWCGEGVLERVEIGGVRYLYCDVCGGELGEDDAGNEGYRRTAP